MAVKIVGFISGELNRTNIASMTEALTHKQRRHSGRAYERIQGRNEHFFYMKENH